MAAGPRASTRWLDIAGVAIASFPVWFLLLVLLWPEVKDVLDGRDLLPDEKVPNYVGNLFELTSFMATTLVLVTAVWAFAFTKSQIEEARNTRLATLYAALESRWASAEMLKSKGEFAKIAFNYMTPQDGAPARTDGQTLQAYAATYVPYLQRKDYGRYSSLMSLIEYLEYIGLLEKNEYLRIDDIQYILGVVCIEVYSIMSVYIEQLREDERQRRARNQIALAPDDFLRFQELAQKFQSRFRS